MLRPDISPAEDLFAPTVHPVDENGRLAIDTSQVQPMTGRDQVVLDGLVAGKTREEWLDTIQAGPRTVGRALTHFQQTRGARTVPHAMRVSIEMGALPVEPDSTFCTSYSTTYLDLYSRGLNTPEIGEAAGVSRSAIVKSLGRLADSLGVGEDAANRHALSVYRLYQIGADPFPGVSDSSERFDRYQRLWRLRAFLAQAFKIPRPASLDDPTVEPINNNLRAVFVAAPKDERVKYTQEWLASPPTDEPPENPDHNTNLIHTGTILRLYYGRVAGMATLARRPNSV